MDMISGQEFLQLVRGRFGHLFIELNLVEIGTDVQTTYAELTAANRVRHLTIGMDWAQDYRVYAKIGKVDTERRPQRGVPNPTKPAEFTNFDLDSVLARSGTPTLNLGRYGSGTVEEVEAALDELVGGLTTAAMPILRGDQRAWDQLADVMASRTANRTD
jgi:hypothetical protein